ncbi:MAG: CCA tRNA nucleotidyltransferase [Terracidiphilus sp.]|jgi:tRNA nucleotidyltransferase/poly(A) polymerase
MPDYIYLLENRLSADQQSALRHLREVAREAGTILFLTGDAVRDLTSGHAVRDLEVAMHGNALKLKKAIEKCGGMVWGEDEAIRALYLCFPGTVRVDLVSTHRVEYPKPGKPVYHPASIQEELRCRDFTVNAMAISLNEGSFGLLMDPMNGAADIESRTLRLVSNYGFLEEPSMLIRATRYMARLGWEMDPKTHTRYMNAKEEGVIEHLSAQARRQELEQIGHEEDGLKVLRAFEAEGWMKVLFPVWNSAKADEAGLTALHDLAVELLLQGVHPDMSAAQMRLLTAKLPGKDLATLKKQMLRPGFVEEWSSLDALAAGFAKALLSKHNSIPSAGFKLFTSYDPEAILWLGFTSRDSVVKERFNLFLKVWPEVRQRIPHTLMQEMRITPELPAYHDIVHSIFLELLDGKLSTPEEARAFLEPHSPPAPPPQVTIKRPRAKRGAEAKLKGDSFDDESEDRLDDDEDLDDMGGDDDDLSMGLHLPKVDLEADLGEGSEAAADDEEDEEESVSSKPAPKLISNKRALNPAAKPKPLKPILVPNAVAKPKEANKPQPAQKPKAQPMPEIVVAASHTAKPGSKTGSSAAPAAQLKSKLTSAKAIQVRKPTPKAKPLVKTKAPVKNSAKAPAKHPVKSQAKIVAKHPVKAKAKAPRPTAAKKKPVKAAKPAVKKAAHKPVRKH